MLSATNYSATGRGIPNTRLIALAARATKYFAISTWTFAVFRVLFRGSKQVLDIEAPQHWSQESVEKVGPWVWSMQSVIVVWYVTAGHSLPEALQLRERMREWDREWSLRPMLMVLRRASLNATINPNSADHAELTEMVETLKNWAHLAA